MKVRSSRGENWLLASCRVTTVSEKVSDVTVISELATAPRTDRAALPSPPNSSWESSRGSWSPIALSTTGRPTPAATARTTPRTGSGHS